DEVLRSETVRTLQFAPDDVSQPLLRQVANDETAAVDLRADAAIGLASAAARGTADENTLDLLATWLSGENETLRDESLRAMRGVLQPTERIKQAYAAVARSLIEEEMSDTERHELADHVALNLIARGKEVPEMELQTFRWQRPATAEGWAKLLDAKGDAAAGRRVFFHPHGPGCYKCHTVHGRGGNVGPDLSNAGRLVREKLVESILEPSKEIAPQFTTWSLVTAAGKVHTGMIVHEDEGRTVVGDVEGKTTTLQTIDIVERVAQRTSTMPEKLTDRMTVGEFRDLLAFLESLR
ncbi:MAG: c-type cytochrome, partial [Planctomycetes bacterium]|nr:c-type cytochrome [Planctomycetota bacterium]